MILYSLTDGDALTTGIKAQPRTCFLMTQLGEPIPDDLLHMRDSLKENLDEHGIALLDASEVVTGRDILDKVWKLIAAVPMTVCLLHKDMPVGTRCNLFFEIGIAQALGKETLVVKGPDTQVPSDFVRTEYVDYGPKFKTEMTKFLKHFDEQADHYETVADQLDNNPLLAIDYLRRAYLISGDAQLAEKARQIFADAKLEGRARNSVESLLVGFGPSKRK